VHDLELNGAVRNDVSWMSLLANPRVAPGRIKLGTRIEETSTDIRIEAKHPVELQMFSRRLQQESAMSTLGNPARLDVRFPRPICHNQSDFWVPAKNLQRSIRTRVIICDYRIDVLADFSVSRRISPSLRTRAIPIKKCL
jgi:hypothetical protein